MSRPATLFERQSLLDLIGAGERSGILPRGEEARASARLGRSPTVEDCRYLLAARRPLLELRFRKRVGALEKRFWAEPLLTDAELEAVLGVFDDALDGGFADLSFEAVENLEDWLVKEPVYARARCFLSEVLQGVLGTLDAEVCEAGGALVEEIVLLDARLADAARRVA